MKKLGIIDWGIGGVGLLNEIRRSSDADIVYFSDAGFTPYGKVPEGELKVRLSEVISFLESMGCGTIAVGCNAASTVLSDQENILGVIEPAIDLVTEMKIESIGIVGGKRTIESGIYKGELEKRGMKVKQQIAQPLSARIEAGDIDSEEMKWDIEQIFGELKAEKYILLACTHYPVISEKIKEFLPDVKLIDPIERMSERIVSRMKDSHGKGIIHWMTSGNVEEMRNVLKIVYGIETNLIERKMI